MSDKEPSGQSVASINDMHRPQRILEIDGWCRKFTGVRKEINVVLARSPSPYTVRYVPRELVVPVNDWMDQCMLAAVANGVAILRGRPVGICSKKAASQALFDYRF